MATTTVKPLLSPPSLLLLLLLSSIISISLAYKPGDIVPMSRMGQYHSVRLFNRAFLFSPFLFQTTPFHLFFLSICSREPCGRIWLVAIVPSSQWIVRYANTSSSFVKLGFFNLILFCCAVWLLWFVIYFVLELDLQVLIPIPKPTGYTGADPYKMWEICFNSMFEFAWFMIIWLLIKHKIVLVRNALAMKHGHW